MNIQEKAKQILTENDLDFRIEKVPMTGEFNGKQIPSAIFGLYNTKTEKTLHYVKKGYNVSQNQDVVEAVLQGIEPFGDKLSVRKALNINGGKKIVIQLAIEGDGLVNGDVIKRYATIIDSNDGTRSLSVGVGDITMSCKNQFVYFYKKGSRFRHNKMISFYISEIPKMIEHALEQSMKRIEIYNAMAQFEVNELEKHRFVKHLLGYDKHFTSIEEQAEKSTRAINIMNSLYESIDAEMASKGTTLWGLHSGVTHFTTHKLSTRKTENARAESITLGRGYGYAKKSFDKALVLMG